MYLNYETDVAGCCGLNALVNLPRSKDEFIRESRIIVENYEEDGKVEGAFVMATTSHSQKPQETYLKELGFRKAGRQKNTNSGNYVTVWLMSRAKFNRTIMGMKG